MAITSIGTSPLGQWAARFVGVWRNCTGARRKGNAACPTGQTRTMSRAISVMHVALSLDVGGLERVVLALVCEARRRGQEVSVVCLERAGALASEAKAAGARVLCVEKQPGLRPSVVDRLRAVLR